MTNPELQKRWRATKTILRRARGAILEPAGDTLEAFHTITKQFEEYLDHNELELALDTLQELGELVPCRGGFWRDLERAAEMMKLHHRTAYFRQRFLECGKK